MTILKFGLLSVLVGMVALHALKHYGTTGAYGVLALALFMTAMTNRNKKLFERRNKKWKKQK